jgi:proline dehydrogenase
MVARFVAGERREQALDALESLRDEGFRTTVDILGESVTSEAAARAAADEYIGTIDALTERGLDRNVSLKLSQMGLGVSGDLCRENVARILARAVERNAFVRIDMEDHTTTDATLAVWRELRPAAAPDDPDPTTGGDAGVVIQSALRRSAADVDALIAAGARVRLCKGAYVEPASVAFQDKAEVDAAFETLMLRLLREGRFPAFATHDDRLVRRAIEVARAEGIAPERFEFQMLYGIRRDLQEQLRRSGYGVRVYVPFGTEWYPYFMRRLAERPANIAFLLRSILREGRRPAAPRD